MTFFSWLVCSARSIVKKGIKLHCMFNVHSPTFQGQLIEEKKTLIFWVQGRVEKIFFFCFKQILKRDMFLKPFFNGFSNLYFTQTGLCIALYATLCIEKMFFYKKSFKFWLFRFNWIAIEENKNDIYLIKESLPQHSIFKSS